MTFFYHVSVSKGVYKIYFPNTQSFLTHLFTACVWLSWGFRSSEAVFHISCFFELSTSLTESAKRRHHSVHLFQTNFPKICMNMKMCSTLSLTLKEVQFGRMLILRSCRHVLVVVVLWGNTSLLLFVPWRWRCRHCFRDLLVRQTSRSERSHSLLQNPSLLEEEQEKLSSQLVDHEYSTSTEFLKTKFGSWRVDAQMKHLLFC